MKNILIAMFILTLGVANINAQVSTNAIVAPSLTLEDTSENDGVPMEFTFGGGGVTVPDTGETSFGVNFTLSAQPLKVPVWFGISQELTWEPSIAGATDLYSDWSFRLYKEKLYLNTGWSVGALYDQNTVAWRSGPEMSLQYYTSGNAFIFGGANYDLLNKSEGGNFHVGGKDSGVRYSLGLGFTF